MWEARGATFFHTKDGEYLAPTEEVVEEGTIAFKSHLRRHMDRKQ